MRSVRYNTFAYIGFSAKAVNRTAFSFTILTNDSTILYYFTITQWYTMCATLAQAIFLSYFTQQTSGTYNKMGNSITYYFASRLHSIPTQRC